MELSATTSHCLCKQGRGVLLVFSVQGAWVTLGVALLPVLDAEIGLKTSASFLKAEVVIKVQVSD